MFITYLTSAFFLLAAWVIWLLGFLASSISGSVVSRLLYILEVVVVVVVVVVVAVVNDH